MSIMPLKSLSNRPDRIVLGVGRVWGGGIGHEETPPSMKITLFAYSETAR